MDIDVSHVEDCKRLAKQCKMVDLIDELESKCKQVYGFGKPVPPTAFFSVKVPFTGVCEDLCGDSLAPVVSNKPGTCVKVLTLEPQNCQLQGEMALLADCAVPSQLRVRLLS